MTRFLFILFAFPCTCLAQPNCNIYHMNGNDSCYQACQIATSGLGSQGSQISQLRFDQAIALCPQLDYAYFEKAVPYLKRGDFNTWKQLIDRAVALNPKEHLGYRGWCRYQFLRDYEGAIRDIETLDSIKTTDIGYGITGDYHLHIARALCYKALGEKQKAIQIILAQLGVKDYTPLNLDYIHLGVLYLETGEPEKAITCFNKSVETNDYYAEAYYYRALAFRKLGKTADFQQDIARARTYYLNDKKMFDNYTELMDRIYLSDIEQAGMK